jgi:hypothetical protein
MSEGIWRTLSTFIYGGSSFVSFVCEVAILVAVATVVRRHRPDAYQGLQLWAIGSLVVFVAMNVARAALPFVSRGDGGIDVFLRNSSLLTIVGTVCHVVLVIVFIRGLTALAQPPKPIQVEGAPPYR